MCIFCDIAQHKAPAAMEYENDNVAVFKTLQPKAPIHLLVVPKRHIESVNDLSGQDSQLVGELIQAAKQVAKQKGIAETGYRLVINTGRDSGKSIDHLHMHLLGGWAETQNE